MNGPGIEISEEEYRAFQVLVQDIVSANSDADFESLSRTAGLDLKSDFSGADLSGVSLSGTDLTGADLNGADLIEADLSGAYMSNANLHGADLSRAKLCGADLRKADLSGADLRGADLHGAVLDQDTRLDTKWRLVWEVVNQDAAGRNLQNTDLSGASLRGAELSKADLRGADLRKADLSGADLRGADLSGADLSEARFADNRGLTEIDKRNMQARGAIFQDSPDSRIPSFASR